MSTFRYTCDVTRKKREKERETGVYFSRGLIPTGKKRPRTRRTQRETSTHRQWRRTGRISTYPWVCRWRRSRRCCWLGRLASCPSRTETHSLSRLGCVSRSLFRSSRCDARERTHRKIVFEFAGESSCATFTLLVSVDGSRPAAHLSLTSYPRSQRSHTQVPRTLTSE